MGFGVFMHRTDSIYDDVPSEKYQFPRQYLGRASQCTGDWVVYLEPSKVAQTKGYFAVAQVERIVPDPTAEGMYLALITPGTYLDFGDPVPLHDADGYPERGLLNDQGRLSGRAQAAIRPLSPDDFTRIVNKGLGREDAILPRVGPMVEIDDEQKPFDHLTARLRADVITNRALRDRNFRKSVLRAYGERCAITGLRLINGGGRAEVEAAHIRPVDRDGPDLVSNGLALSGTAHWMFDRGLVGLSDSLEILVSRQANDAEAVRKMINSTGNLIVPALLADKPRPEFLRWHRENCFKN